MPIAEHQLHSILQQAFPDSEIAINDLAGDGDHYAVEITDASFLGKTRIAQHQMVYQALGDALGGDLHALALKTKAS